MRLLIAVMACCVSIAFSYAQETEEREWSTNSGHKTEAVAIKLEDDIVHLKKINGSVVKLQMALLTESDQDFLTNHFGKEENVDAVTTEVKGSGIAQAVGLPLPMGKISGPIQHKGSNYFVYLPKTLKTGRDAPLLFYTHSGGAKKPKLIEVLTDAADLLGWVMAISVESRNKGTKNGMHVTNCLEHIFETLPVDEDRIHYTGNSGGAARAFLNTKLKKAYGVMPNVGYIPFGTEPSSKVAYVLGGGKDYNRYASAIAASKFGKFGFHRMSPGGHGNNSPAEFYMDGMIWMHCQYMKAKNPTRAEKADFEASMINWLNELKETNSKRTYSTACILRDVYKISGSNATLNDAIISELSADKNNILYHEGIIDIDELSEKTLQIPGGSKYGHFCKEAAKYAEKLKSKYSSIKEINDVLDAIISKT